MNDLEKLSKALLRIKPILDDHLTIEETACLLNISASSVDKALHFVRKNASLLPQIDSSIKPTLFLENLAQTLKANTIKATLNVKHTGGKKLTWTESDALRIAYLFLANGYTLREAEESFEYPKSTIYEILNSEYVRKIPDLYIDIQRLFQLNMILRTPTNQNTESELLSYKIVNINKVEKAQIQKYFLMQKYEGFIKEEGHFCAKK